MTKKFEDIEPGDQLEMPASRGSILRYTGKEFDPDKVVEVAVVTDRWYDPVDAKEYVGLAILRRGGVYGKPTRKHTVRGLASNGWRPASRDWIAWAKATDGAIKDGLIIPMRKRK